MAEALYMLVAQLPGLEPERKVAIIRRVDFGVFDLTPNIYRVIAQSQIPAFGPLSRECGLRRMENWEAM